MSLESSIAALTTQAGLLLDLPGQIAATANAKLAELAAQFKTRQDSMLTLFHVDQALGSDAATGALDAPLKLLDEALRRTPAGGGCTVRLLSSYTLSADITIYNKYLRIESPDATRRDFIFGKLLRDESSTVKRSCANMRLAHRSQVVFAYINLKLPSLGDMAGYAESAWNSAFCVSQIHSPMISLLLYRCGLERPADCMSSLLPAITALSIYVASCTETSSPMTGWWVTGVTAPAGTSTSNLPYLVTNLATI